MPTYGIRTEILFTHDDDATDEDFINSDVEYTILESSVLVVESIKEAGEIYGNITD